MEDAYLDVNSMGELDGSSPAVILPSVQCPLSEEDMESLRDTINVIRPSQSHGREIYLDVLNFVLNHRSKMESTFTFGLFNTVKIHEYLILLFVVM